MTRTGINRLEYSRTVETAPSRFAGDDRYAEWAARADAWARETGRVPIN